jgi:hypothetical protein
MMFLAHLFNHTAAGKRSLEDVIGILGKQLRSLGHEAIWDPENDKRINEGGVTFAAGPDMINVIVEGFTPPIIDYLRSVKQQTGCRFICLATEEPTPDGFNHGTQREMVWRQEIFPTAAELFDGILHLVPGKSTADWYAQYAPTAYVELGHAPSLERFGNMAVEPKYDFGFYGSLTPRRLHLLKRLAKRTGKRDAIRVMADFGEQGDRDAAMREAKVILQIRKFDEMGLVSSSRCNTALCCGRPVVAESHDLELSAVWNDIVKFSKTEEEFFSMAMLAAKNWRGMHAAQFRRFKEKLTPEVCVGAALRKIGLEATGRKAASGLEGLQAA